MIYGNFEVKEITDEKRYVQFNEHTLVSLVGMPKHLNPEVKHTQNP